MEEIFCKKQEEIRKAEEAQRALLASSSRQNPYDQYRPQSSWYFYNNTTVQTGKTEFMRIWGARKYEDNWRLSDKQQTFDFITFLNKSIEFTIKKEKEIYF